MIAKDVYIRTVKLLRRQFTWSETYKNVKKRHLIHPGIYFCGGCNQFLCASEELADLFVKARAGDSENVILSSYVIDHIDPVGPASYSLDEAYSKIFCKEENLQLLCTCCSYLKTQMVDLPLIREMKAKNKKE